MEQLSVFFICLAQIDAFADAFLTRLLIKSLTAAAFCQFEVFIRDLVKSRFNAKATRYFSFFFFQVFPLVI